MTYNFGLTPSFNVSRPEGSSKAASFSSSSAKKSCSFRDVLNNTVSCRSRNEIKTDAVKAEEVITDAVTDTEKELVSKSESKLKSNSSENLEPAEEPKEKQEVNEAVIIEKLLLKLEELVNMQNSEDITGDKQILLLDNIKKILTELAELQTGNTGPEAAKLQIRAEELVAVLGEVKKESEADGSTNDMQKAQDLPDKLKAIASDVPDEAGNDAAEQLKEPAKSDIAEENQDKDAPVKSKDNSTEESGMPKAAPEKQKPAVKTETHNNSSDLPSKEDRPEAAPKEENIKSALDGKVEKITVEARTDKEQESEKGESLKADKADKPINTFYDKPDTEAAAFKQEESTFFNKAETVQNQAAAPKLQAVDRSEIINQIVKKAEVIFTDVQSEMRMQLEPENLGKLTLKVAVERGLITAKFVVESYEVKQVIESNFNELKDLLQDKGLDIQNINVSVGQHSKEFDYSRNSELWKEQLKSGGQNIRQARYNGYLEGVGAAKVNPYGVHIGEFDQRA